MARRIFLCSASGYCMPCSKPDHKSACASSFPSTHGAALSQKQMLGDMKMRYGLAPERGSGLSMSLSSVDNAPFAIFSQDNQRNKRKQANGMPQEGSRGDTLPDSLQLIKE